MNGPMVAVLVAAVIGSLPWLWRARQVRVVWEDKKRFWRCLLLWAGYLLFNQAVYFLGLVIFTTFIQVDAEGWRGVLLLFVGLTYFCGPTAFGKLESMMGLSCSEVGLDQPEWDEPWFFNKIIFLGVVVFLVGAGLTVVGY